MKAFNRRNEQLADAAERASVAAEWVGGPAYPRERLRTAWTRFLWHQFHDDLTGTSIPQAYQFSWNDELISLEPVRVDADRRRRRRGERSRHAPGDVRSASGHASLVVYQRARHRSGPTRSRRRCSGPARRPTAVRVVDTDHGTRRAGAGAVEPGGQRHGRVPGRRCRRLAFKVFDVVRARAPGRAGVRSRSPQSSLENERYVGQARRQRRRRVDLRQGGRHRAPEGARPPRAVRRPVVPLAGLGDPVGHGQQAAAGVRRQARGPHPRARPGAGRARGDADRRRARRSCSASAWPRAAIASSSTPRWTGGRPGPLLKASFPFDRVQPQGHLRPRPRHDRAPQRRRPISTRCPAQQWADLTDASGRFGVAVVNDSKYGWDKPADNELRLTLIHTPRPSENYVYQSSNDIGQHHFTYAIAGHAGGLARRARADDRAARLNQPLVAFQAQPHAGALGRSLAIARDERHRTARWRCARSRRPRTRTRLVDSRAGTLREADRHACRSRCPAASQKAREINAAEEPVGDARGGRAAS